MFPLNPLLIVLPIVSSFSHLYRENKSPKLIKHEVSSIQTLSDSLPPLPNILRIEWTQATDLQLHHHT